MYIMSSIIIVKSNYKWIFSKGARSSDARALQGYLNLVQDGIFDILTEEAVKMFQDKYHLHINDIAGGQKHYWTQWNIKIICTKTKRDEKNQ